MLTNKGIVRIVPLILLLLLTACAEEHSVPLMPAPVIYQDTTVDPYAHLKPEEKNTLLSVFYATNRKPRTTAKVISYSNEMSSMLHLGEAQIRFGDQQTSWENLQLASTHADRQDPMHLTLEKTSELATVHADALHSQTLNFSSELHLFADAVNTQLARVRDKEIIIYVHGAKGSFLKSVALTAEINHFSGRDFVGVAFSWPSHQEIISYVAGEDVSRAEHSTTSLRTLIEFLAEYTTVKKINIICYSAGGKLVTKALYEMHQYHTRLDGGGLREKFKLGTVLFTAADVSVDRFLKRLPAIAEMAQQVVVTVSGADDALHFSALIMGGADRIGTTEAEIREETFARKNAIDNFEIVDFSFGREKRGFDITGHHYWHRHPWASSDIIFLLRTDLPARQRGLSISDVDNIWYLSPDYPVQVRNAVRTELQGEW